MHEKYTQHDDVNNGHERHVCYQKVSFVHVIRFSLLLTLCNPWEMLEIGLKWQNIVKFWLNTETFKL